MKFIDIFVGTGGIRMAFERLGTQCVYSSEWNVYVQQTYSANLGDIGSVFMLTQTSLNDSGDAHVNDGNVLTFAIVAASVELRC